MTYGYRLLVYKQDRRTKTGERFVKSYEYSNYSGNAMMDEVKDLKRTLYPPSEGWRLDFEPLTKTVVNLMSGKPVEIAYNTPGCCDPSTETYWSM